MANYEVIVGNIGYVYGGRNKREAEKSYNEYVSQSLGGYSRAAGENVTWLGDGEIIKEHIGMTCPRCGGHHVDPPFGHKLAKCLTCHGAFDTAEE